MVAQRTDLQNAFETQLTAQMGPNDLSAAVGSVGLLTDDFYLVIEPDNDSQREYIFFDGAHTGSTFVTTNIANRYLEGSAATSNLTHPVGSIVRCVPVSFHISDAHDRMDGHFGSTQVSAHPEVTPSVRGFMSAADKTYLDAVGVLLPTPDAADVLAALLTVDGPGSGLNADLLDGIEAAGFGTAADVSTLQSDVATLQAQVASLALSRVVAGSNTTHTNTTVTATTPSFTTVASVALTPPSHWDSYTIVMMGRARTATNAVSPQDRLVRGSTVVAGGEGHTNVNGDDSTFVRFAAQSGITAGIGSSQTFAYQLAKIGGGDPNFTAFQPSLSVVLLGAWTP